jgi:hypothetical protein
MRLVVLQDGHLSRLSNREKGSVEESCREDADRLSHCFKLLMSTHTALFRSQSPLLLDFDQPQNAALFGGNIELIKEAKRLRTLILYCPLENIYFRGLLGTVAGTREECSPHCR